MFPKLGPSAALRSGVPYDLSAATDDPFSGELDDMPPLDVPEEYFRTYFYPTKASVWRQLLLARSRPELMAACTDDPFGRYLRGTGTVLALGQMCKVLTLARHPASPLTSDFADWIRRDRPWLLPGLGRIRTDRIVDFRNREDHPDARVPNAQEAEEASRICREVIDLLRPR
jgi:hypothetical protein